MVSKLLADWHSALLAARLLLAAARRRTSGPVHGAAQRFLNASDTGLTTPPKKPTIALTPEMRGDIFMAEKRFREAAEMYQENSKGSAVMLNKTGIAYHQMLQLNIAEKYYRLALARGSEVLRSGEQSGDGLLRQEKLPARDESI